MNDGTTHLLTANIARELLRFIGPRLVRVPGVMTYAEACVKAIADGEVVCVAREAAPAALDDDGSAHFADERP